jgi:hypothetical protein
MNCKEKPKVKIKNDKFELMIVNKTPLKNIVKDNKLLNNIDDLVSKVNKIVIQASQFLNLYLIYLFDNNLPFPDIDKQFILTIFSVITKKQDGRGKKPSDETIKLIETLEDFYNKHYKQCIIDSDIINIDKLSFVLAYEAIDIVKNIKNNITVHFEDYINKFVNQSYEVKSIINDINKRKIDSETKKEMKNSVYSDLRTVKKDLLRTDNKFVSDDFFHEWIKEHKPKIISKNKFDKDSLNYDICSNPIDYLKSLIYMNKHLEKLNEQRIKDNKEQFKLFQVIPQRTSIKQNYITLDSCGLINLVIKENFKKYLDNVQEYKDELWDNNFRTNKKEFKRKGYQFNYMIKTDGVGCSVLLVKLKDGKPIYITSKLQNETKEKIYNLDKYIEDTKINNDMKKKRIVSIDPNLSDIIYCVSKDINEKIIIDENDKLKVIEDEKIITFRYTQNQRRLETRNKKYNKLQDKINKDKKINNKSVKEIETELSKFNSKTCNYNKFIEYCKKKNEVNRILFNHYSEKVFRKLKFNRYTNTQKSESKMIKNFANKFGKPNECTVILGDYDKGGHNIKGKEPIINKRIRKIFRNNGYDVFMINEFRTSKTCNVCGSCCNTFMKRESNIPKHTDKIIGKVKTIEVWGLTLCENKNCSQIHNRDKNSALNMYTIVESIYKGLGRPKTYCRENKNIIPT